MAAIGDVDEANSAIGLAIAQGMPAHIGALLRRAQNDLFDLGADLATPTETAHALRIVPEQVVWIETMIDRLNADLGPLTSFILPGGSQAAAATHLARATVRRAERSATRAAEQGPVGRPALTYLNRLSDLLFVIARVLNDGGAGDILWQPGATRGQG